MAQKYTVKKGESALTLGKKFGVPPQTILNQNQIKSLTAGQTIRIPVRMRPGRKWAYFPHLAPYPRIIPSRDRWEELPFHPGYYYGDLQSAKELRADYVSELNAGLVDFSEPSTTPPSAGSLPAAGIGGKRPPFPFQQRNYFSAPPFSSAGSQARMNEAYVPPPIQPGYVDYGQRVNQGLVTPTNSTKPPMPTGIYTGGDSANDRAWRNYWNYQAANPSPKPPPPPKVMTRDEIWNMKANQRRRRMAQEQEQGQEQDMGTVSGNASNMMVNWRING